MKGILQNFTLITEKNKPSFHCQSLFVSGDSDNEISDKKPSQSDDITLDNNAIFSDDEEQQGTEICY